MIAVSTKKILKGYYENEKLNELKKIIKSHDTAECLIKYNESTTHYNSFVPASKTPSSWRVFYTESKYDYIDIYHNHLEKSDLIKICEWFIS